MVLTQILSFSRWFECGSGAVAKVLREGDRVLIIQASQGG
jgi:hypothetical protein